MRGGQALRGSSELHAWGDSNLYVRRKGAHLRLSTEHRTAPSGEDVWLDLVVKDQAVALAVRDAPIEAETATTTPAHRIERALAQAGRFLTQRELRAQCKMQAARLGEVLGTLISAGRVLKTAKGYELVGGAGEQPVLFPTLSPGLKGNGNGKRSERNSA